MGFLKREEMVLEKKGLSPVIATVLLISLSLVLVSIVLIWMLGFVSEQLEKQGKPIEQVCKDVSFEVDSSPYNSNDRSLKFQVLNTGNSNIWGLDVRFVSEKASSRSSFSLQTPSGEVSELYDLKITDDKTTKIILYPMVLGSARGKKVTKPVSCLEVSTTIDLNE